MHHVWGESWKGSTMEKRLHTLLVSSWSGFFMLKKSLSFFFGDFSNGQLHFSLPYTKKKLRVEALKRALEPQTLPEKKKMSFLLSLMTRRSTQLTAFSNKDSLRCGLRSWSVAGTYRIMRSRMPIQPCANCRTAHLRMGNPDTALRIWNFCYLLFFASLIFQFFPLSFPRILGLSSFFFVFYSIASSSGPFL